MDFCCYGCRGYHVLLSFALVEDWLLQKLLLLLSLLLLSKVGGTELFDVGKLGPSSTVEQDLSSRLFWGVSGIITIDAFPSCWC